MIIGIKENENELLFNNNNALMEQNWNNNEKNREININNVQNKEYHKSIGYNNQVQGLFNNNRIKINPIIYPYGNTKMMNEIEYNSYANINYDHPFPKIRKIEKTYLNINNTILKENEENYRQSSIINDNKTENKEN